MPLNIFEPTPIIFHTDKGNSFDYLPSISADESKRVPKFDRGELYALLPKIPTDPCGYSFLVVVKASDGIRLDSMTKGQADLLKCYFSTRNINEQDAQTLGQVIMKLGFSFQRCQALQKSYHDSRLESLRDGGYFNIESRTIISISLDQILEKALNPPY